MNNAVPDPLNLPLSIAPMIDWTYTHFRVLMRYLAPNALLYTEMQTTGAIQNNPKRALEFHAQEHPLALQLGGSDIQALVQAAKTAEQAGYDEVNLNLGCPSDKVQAGRFGACLMYEAEHVTNCLRAIKDAVNIPVTAKTRIGVDQQDSYAFFSDFVHTIIHSGCDKLIVHARKAWLNGLNPKQNRTIPPVNYDYVYQIKRELPNLPVVINGNISTLNAIKEHLQQLDGVMLGRLACDNPYKISEIHQSLYPETIALSRSEILSKYSEYLIAQHSQGISLSLLIKPIFGLAFGLPGASQWKQQLMELLKTKDISLLQTINDYLVNIESQELLLVSA